MKWSREKTEQEKQRVKSVLVRKPNASKYELAKILGIDKDVALRFKNQVIKENTSRVSDQKINVEIGKLEAEYEQLALECWQIITQDIRKIKTNKLIDGKLLEVDEEFIITPKEKMVAVKTLIDAKKILFNIKFDAGIFSRKLGKLDIGKTLNKEERDLISKAIALNYGTKEDPESTATYSEENGSGVASGEDK